jgi:hypothetical protein
MPRHRAARSICRSSSRTDNTAIWVGARPCACPLVPARLCLLGLTRLCLPARATTRVRPYKRTQFALLCHSRMLLAGIQQSYGSTAPHVSARIANGQPGCPTEAFGHDSGTRTKAQIMPAPSIHPAKETRSRSETVPTVCTIALHDYRTIALRITRRDRNHRHLSVRHRDQPLILDREHGVMCAGRRPHRGKAAQRFVDQHR